MTRYHLWLAALGVAALPDWASACQPAPYPVPYWPCPAGYPAQIVVVPPCLPVYEAPLPPPRVEPQPATKPAEMPKPDPVRPTAEREPVRPPPEAVTPPTTPAVPAVPAPSLRPEPPRADVIPPPPVPLPAPTPLPPKADPLFTLPPVPSARPTPAPAPPDFTLPAVPPAAPPPAPKLSAPVEPAKPPADAPPATLILPPVTARSSPLSGLGGAGPKVRAIPVAAASGAAAGKRKVGFFNHTDRAVELVVEGEQVTLPGRHYVHADLPAAFTWKLGDAPAERVTVPADQAGVELLIGE